MTPFDQVSKVFGEAIASLLVALSSTYADIQGRNLPFSKFQYLTNDEYLRELTPQEVVSSYGFENVVLSKVDNDLREIFLVERERETDFEYQVLQNTFFFDSLLAPKLNLPTSQQTDTPIDFDDLSKIFDISFKELVVSREYVEKEQQEIRLIKEFQLDETIRWRIIASLDQRHNDIFILNEIVNSRGLALPFEMEKVFNISFRLDSVRPAEIANLTGLSILMYLDAKNHA